MWAPVVGGPAANKLGFHKTAIDGDRRFKNIAAFSDKMIQFCCSQQRP